MSSFQSGITNFSEIRKRMDELGIRPFVEDLSEDKKPLGVDVSTPANPAPKKDDSYYWPGY